MKHPLCENDYSLFYSFVPLEMVKHSLIKDILNYNFAETSNPLLTLDINHPKKDISYSMERSKLSIAKESLIYFLKSLPNTESKLNVISFGQLSKKFLMVSLILLKKI